MYQFASNPPRQARNLKVQVWVSLGKNSKKEKTISGHEGISHCKCHRVFPRGSLASRLLRFPLSGIAPFRRGGIQLAIQYPKRWVACYLILLMKVFFVIQLSTLDPRITHFQAKLISLGV